MKVILKGRAQGKTMDLIKEADGYKGYIVCLTQDECHRVASVAREMGCKINFPLSFNEFKNREYGPLVGHFLIDNADEILRQMTIFPIRAITITKPE